jgi:hypothetical protein
VSCHCHLHYHAAVSVSIAAPASVNKTLLPSEVNPARTHMESIRHLFAILRETFLPTHYKVITIQLADQNYIPRTYRTFTLKRVKAF